MSEIDDQIKDYPSCRDRIEDQLINREEYMQGAIDATNNEEPYDGFDDAIECIWDFAMEIQKKLHLKILLSYGGPSDWIEVIIDQDSDGFEIDRMTYHFADWFDHAEVRLSNDSPLYVYVEQYVLEALTN